MAPTTPIRFIAEQTGVRLRVARVVGRGRAPAGRNTLACRRKTIKADSPLLASDLMDLGRNLLNRGRWSDAESLLREGREICEKAMPHNWRRCDARSLLGGGLLGQGLYREAEPLILTGYEEMRAHESRIPVPERFRLREAAERLVRLYEEWGKSDQATAWKAKVGMPDLPADVFALP